MENLENKTILTTETGTPNSTIEINQPSSVSGENTNLTQLESKLTSLPKNNEVPSDVQSNEAAVINNITKDPIEGLEETAIEAAKDPSEENLSRLSAAVVNSN